MNQFELTALICSRPQNFSWFLGAGSSRSAGLPTATDLLWDMKRRYYCREEGQDIKRQDMQVEAIQTKIQSYLEANGFPQLWDDDEYPICFEKIFGEDIKLQREYIAAMLSEKKVSLSVGHRVLGALLKSGATRIAFTTNFDSVIEKAVAKVSGSSLSAFHLEGATSAIDALNNEEFPIYCKLHGDFRYDSIKNLPDDLAQQNAHLSQCLVNAANRFGFVVVGYSGRDASIMELFQSALSSPNPFPHGLYWTGIKGSSPISSVQNLLDEAREKGVSADYVPIETFDSLLSRVWKNIEDRSSDLDKKVRKSELSEVKIPIPENGTKQPILRLNALPIRKLPNNCQIVKFNQPIGWPELKKAQREAEGRLVFTKAEEIWFWGESSLVREHFGSKMVSIETKELPTNLDHPSHLHFRGFLVEALAKALSRNTPLLARTQRTGSWLIVDGQSDNTAALSGLQQVVAQVSGEIPGLFTESTDENPNREKVRWAEAARISLEVKDKHTWLQIDPDIWIWPTRARRDAIEFLGRRRSDRRNDKFDAVLGAWVGLILGPHKRNTEIQFNAFDGGTEVENPRFVIGSRTAFSRGLN